MSVFFELKGNFNMSSELKNEERLFGTDGIRGTVNKGKITALMAVKLAMALVIISLAERAQKNLVF